MEVCQMNGCLTTIHIIHPQLIRFRCIIPFSNDCKMPYSLPRISTLSALLCLQLIYPAPVSGTSGPPRCFKKQ